MREIKFRGKCKITKKWIISEGMMKHKDGTIILIEEQREDDLTTSPIIPETIGQYTGLKDKNGKEIYEGDIVQYMSSTKFDENGNHILFKGVIEKWIGQMGVGFRYRSGSFTMMLKLGHSFNISVIGNIHETPELLK